MFVCSIAFFLRMCQLGLSSKLQVSHVLRTSALTLLFPPVQRQQGYSDCGLLLILHSFCGVPMPWWKSSLYHILAPQLSVAFLKCLEEQKLTPFPSQRKRRQRSLVKTKLPLPAYCVCRLPEEGDMVACDKCGEWFHKDCVITPAIVWEKKNKRNVTWFCNLCAS